MEPEFVDIFAGVTIADEAWAAAQFAANGSEPPQEPFAGLSHAEVLALELPPERMLVSDLVPIGTVGTIAGVPETYKSWQAQRIAFMVGSGEGEIFGKSVQHSGPVGYFWQDDSTREEAERVKLFDAVRTETSSVDVRWFLNEGLQLPQELGRLRMTIEHHGFVLVVLDSFYNVLFGMDLKDEGAERVVARLKTEVCDETNCTVLIVDHMPWATEVNRGRLRSYGGVFKNAATRFGIYIDAVGSKLWVEARGNNIAGFKRTLAEWDSETLEMRLIDTSQGVDEAEYEQRILDALQEKGGQTTDELNAIKGTKSALVKARKRLLDAQKVVRRKDRTSYSGYVWYLAQPSEESGSTVENEPVVDSNWFGGSTGSPLRGEYGGEPVSTPTTETRNPLLDEFGETCRQCGRGFNRGSGNRGDLCRRCVAEELSES
jgi:hypothetical protein